MWYHYSEKLAEKKITMAQENNGHRARLRERMMKEGLSSFQDHEVLELLLFQYLPYKDTNKIAHNLLSKFGSFAGVLNATPQQLMTIKGISQVTACNIAMLKEVLVRYRRSEADKINLGKMDSIIAYAKKLVEDDYCERLIVVYVDHSTNFLFKDEFTSNRTEIVNADVKQIVASAMRLNAAGVILFHCHVGGDCHPSVADKAFTQKLFVALTSMGVMLLEHIIFNNANSLFSFFNEGLIDELSTNYKKTF